MGAIEINATNVDTLSSIYIYIYISSKHALNDKCNMDYNVNNRRILVIF